ncbi:MAG: helix-turn-helix transcriptional regulator [Solobacterium sp.]|nr:helix-turn-helix transcriptional regulator [Solobacterium sp.]
MGVTYRKLFHKLIEEEMTPKQLADQAGISLNIMTRIRRNEYISLESVEKITRILQCDIGDILEFTQAGKEDGNG